MIKSSILCSIVVAIIITLSLPILAPAQSSTSTSERQNKIEALIVKQEKACEGILAEDYSCISNPEEYYD